MLEIVASYPCMQFQEKLMNETRENSKKSSFRPDFGQNLGPKNFFVVLPPLNIRKLLQAITAYYFKEN